MTGYYVIFLHLISFILADLNASEPKFPVTNDSDNVIHYEHLSDFFQKVSKCCPHASTYSPSKRVCLFSVEKKSSKWKLFSHSPETKRPIGTPACGKNDVVVDYEVLVPVNLEEEFSESTEGSGGTANLRNLETNCENGDCDGILSAERYPLDSTDGNLTRGNLWNNSTIINSTEHRDREIKIFSANVDNGTSFIARFSNQNSDDLPTFFLPDGTLRIGDEDHRANEFCIDVRDESENFIKLTARVCEASARWCKGGRACVSKCCVGGESMLEKRPLGPNQGGDGRPSSLRRMCTQSTLGFQVQKLLTTRTPIGVMYGEPCGPEGKYLLKPHERKDDYWKLKPDGSLFIPDTSEGPLTFPHTRSCLERVYSPSDKLDGIFAYVCFPQNKELGESNGKMDTKELVVGWMYGYALCISCFFLVATLVAYALLPSLRNLHGVTLVAHASCLLVAFLCLAVAKFTQDIERGMLGCKILGFSLLFTFLAAFSWLNVMCFDIWWTFGGKSRGAKPGQRGGSGKSGGPLQGNLQRFIYYSLYAWVLPLTITALTALADKYGTGILPYKLPQIGEVKCWFKDDGGWAVVIHFVGPSTIFLAADMIMFSMTAVRCWRIKTEIQRMQRSDKEDVSEGDGKRKFGRKWLQQSYKADKERLTMTLKLCAAMGINWSLEIASWWLSRGKDEPSAERILPMETWYSTDLANCLHGIFVFIIFVGKKKILAQLWKRIKDICGCYPKGTAGHEDQNINRQDQNSYNTSSLHDNSAANEGRTYNFDSGDGRKISPIRQWLINHGIYSRRKRISRCSERYLSKMSTTTTSISADMSRGNFSYIP